MARLALAALLVVALTLAGCSGGDGSDSSSGSSSSSAATTSTSTPRTTVVTSTALIYDTTHVTVTSTSTGAATTTSSGATTPAEPPNAYPTVDNVTISGIGANTATVAWDAADDLDKVQSNVDYSADPPTFASSTPIQLGSGHHTAPLTGLASCTDHTFRVTAVDGSGQTTRTTGIPFKTLSGPALGVTAITVTNTLATSLQFTYSVSGPADARSHLEYGTTTALGSATSDVTGTGTKSATLSSLAPNTVYHVRVAAASPCGSMMTPDATYSTALLVHVDIKANGGSVNSFCPGSTAPCSGTSPATCPPTAQPGSLCVPAAKDLVFNVTNLDTATHTWELVGAGGYTSSTIAASRSYQFPASVKLAAGTYTMRCTIHTSMTGNVVAV